MPKTVTEKQRANLRPFVAGSEHARESAAKSVNARAKVAETLVTRPRKLTEAQWTRLYLDPAFEGEWKAFFYNTRHDLERHYAPTRDESPQYRAMCWRLAVLMTVAAQMDVAHGELMERLAVEDRIKNLVAQLQRHTEAQKHLDVVITDDRERLLEKLVAVVERKVRDRQVLAEVLQGWRVVLETGDLGKMGEEVPALTSGEE